jgi:cathepsin L
MKSAILIIALLGCISAKTLSHQLNGYTFEDYLTEYSKKYEGDEYSQRKEIFEANLKSILVHNANPSVTYKRGVNQFTDQTQEEVRKLSGYVKSMGVLQRANSNASTFKPTGIQVPDSFDWREVHPSVISPVKNQGHCGSCWTFASAATLESHWAIATGHLQDFSE